MQNVAFLSKLMHGQRHGNICCLGAGGHGAEGRIGALVCWARICWNQSWPMAWLRLRDTQRARAARLSSLSFSMLWIIGYPHVINRYRPRGVVLTTFIKLFLFDAG